MSIATEIQKLQTNLSNSYASCSSKGATLPTNQNFDNLASTIDSISGGGGGGATITAVNKTGSAISGGQKVWLNDGGQTAGTSYTVNLVNSTAINQYGFAIDHTGTRAIGYKWIWDLTSTEGTKVTEFSSARAIYGIRYGENSTWTNGFRFDASAWFALSNSQDIYVGDDYITNRGGMYISISKIDLSTGEVLNTYSSSSVRWSSTLNYWSLIKIGNYFYYITSDTDTQGVFTINEETNSLDKVYDLSGYNNLPNPFCIMGVTSDHKYVIGKSYYPATGDSGNLTIVELLSENQIKVLQPNEWPVDLQYFDGKTVTGNFNPYTGLLTLAEGLTSYKPSDYIFMKYNNGTWTKLNIELPSYNIMRTLTISNDLSRAGIGSFNSSYGQVCNLTTQSGYIAQNYSLNIITENSITGYAAEDAAADASFTANIASQNSGGGSNPGEEITAINKTRRVINEGDKVWVNQHSQVAGSNFNIEVNSNNGNVFIDLTGTWAWSNNKYFTLTDSSGTQIGTTNVSGASVSNLRYGPQNSIFFGSWRLDPEAIYHLSDTYIGGNYMIRSSGLAMKIESFDLATGNVIETYDWDLSKTQMNSALVVYNYGENNTPSVYMWGISPNTTCYRYYIETGSFSKYTTNGTMKPIAVTPDNKYLIGYTVSSNYLRMADISTNNGKPVILSQLQMPEDLQPYYSEKECKMCFNPHNNILSIAGINNSNYVVMKYNNGEWTKLNVEIPAPLQFCTILTFSNDLSRCCFANYEDTHFKVINLTSYEEYIAQDYSAYVNNEQTITGVALETVQPDETLSIGTVVPK